MDESHRAATHFECLLCANLTTYPSRDELHTHILREHGGSVLPKDEAAIMDLCVRSSILVPSACPVCGESSQGKELDSFLDHMGECIHQFSLLALPWAFVAQGYKASAEQLQAMSTWLQHVECNHEDVEDTHIAIPYFETQSSSGFSAGIEMDECLRPVRPEDYFNAGDSDSQQTAQESNRSRDMKNLESVHSEGTNSHPELASPEFISSRNEDDSNIQTAAARGPISSTTLAKQSGAHVRSEDSGTSTTDRHADNSTRSTKRQRHDDESDYKRGKAAFPEIATEPTENENPPLVHNPSEPGTSYAMPTKDESQKVMGSISASIRLKADSVAIIGAGPSGLAAAK
jgi:hypothetical protein